MLFRSPLMEMSDDSLQAFVGDDVQKLECRARRVGFALFPFAYGRCGCVQVKCKHGLTEPETFTQALDIGGLEISYWRGADRIELAHCHLVDGSGFVKRFEILAQRFNDLAHNAPLSKHRRVD